VIDDRLAEGAQRAGADLACRLGCTECCHGPFPIDALDADRLKRGLADLAQRDGARADAVRSRAAGAWARLRSSFPGDAATGALDVDEAGHEAFFESWAGEPCPALDPETGACELYEHRPLSCRTYGLPVRIAAEDLPPCRLCFAGASAARIEACRVIPDPDDAAAVVLRALDPTGGSDTIVAFALIS
jgi:Fe-S-cluster containining protein